MNKKRVKRFNKPEHTLKLIWQNEYSSTMENDEYGRWGRSVYVKGSQKQWGNIRLISWIKRTWVESMEQYIYTANCQFPVSCGNSDTFITALDLDKLKKAVEDSWQEYMNFLQGKPFRLMPTNICKEDC